LSFIGGGISACDARPYGVAEGPEAPKKARKGFPPARKRARIQGGQFSCFLRLARSVKGLPFLPDAPPSGCASAAIPQPMNERKDHEQARL
jgi:hypothetical protein